LHAGPILAAVRLDKFEPEHVANLYAVLRANGRSSDAVHRVARSTLAAAGGQLDDDQAIDEALAASES
jgi:hypothetical protein